MIRKAAFLSLTAFVLAVILIGTGILVGFHLRDKRFRRHFRELEKAETLGDILGPGPEARQALSWAYTDRNEAIGLMDEISWSVPTVPTPFLGTAPQPGVWANASINGLQFRDGREVVMPKPEGVIRVFLVGGSTAFGVGAPSGDRTIGAFLEARLNSLGAVDGSRYEVMTMACPSWASTQERIAVENRLSELAPDWIVSLTGANDTHWGRLGRNVLWFRTYQDHSFWTVADNYYQAFSGESLPDVEDRSDDSVDAQTVSRRWFKNLRLAALALPPSARYLAVLQPTLYSVERPLSEREQGLWNTQDDDYFDACFEALRSRLQELSDTLASFDSLDGSRLFDALPGQEVFLDSYHFGDRGNRIIADAVADYMLALRADGADERASQDPAR